MKAKSRKGMERKKRRIEKRGMEKRRRTEKRGRKRMERKGGDSSRTTTEQIPKILHQIWFGSSVTSWRKYLFDKMKAVAEKNGYQYKLWLETDRNKDNFPITYPYQRDSLISGENIGQNRFAQVADFARLELIYTFGGIYLDSTFIVNDDFFAEIERMNIEQHKTFIGCNEDPCGLDCHNNAGKKYLSNAFFAATKKNRILKRLLDTDIMDEIDLDSEAINHTTGPYYFRSGITDQDIPTVGLIDTNKIYPFPMSGSEMREYVPNHCLSTSNQKNATQIQVTKDKYLDLDCMETMPPGTLAVCLVGLGGTWSL